jgi:hypothetical protein
VSGRQLTERRAHNMPRGGVPVGFRHPVAVEPVPLVVRAHHDCAGDCQRVHRAAHLQPGEQVLHRVLCGAASCFVLLPLLGTLACASSCLRRCGMRKQGICRRRPCTRHALMGFGFGVCTADGVSCFRCWAASSWWAWARRCSTQCATVARRRSDRRRTHSRPRFVLSPPPWQRQQDDT